MRVGAHGGGAQTYPSIAVDADQTVWITWLATNDPYDFPNNAPTTGAVYYVAKNEQGWGQPLRPDQVRHYPLAAPTLCLAGFC